MIIVNENMETELLLNTVQEIFDRISEWYRKMQDALIHEAGLQVILDLSESIIGNTINISDSAFTLLARTTHIETDDPISLALAEFGYHPESTLQLFRQNHRFEVWNNAQSLLINDSKTISQYVLSQGVPIPKHLFYSCGNGLRPSSHVCWAAGAVLHFDRYFGHLCGAELEG